MPNQYSGSVGRSEIVVIRLTPEEMRDLRTRASARGATYSDVVREALGFRAPDPDERAMEDK